jgi:hypothetical protein
MKAPNGGQRRGQERRRRFREGGQGRQADHVRQVRSPEEEKKEDGMTWPE